MRWIEFYGMSTGITWDRNAGKVIPCEPKPIPMCGSDSVRQLDGRFSMSTCASIGRELTRQMRTLHPSCVGFAIIAGLKLTDTHVVRELELVSE